MTKKDSYLNELKGSYVNEVKERYLQELIDWKLTTMEVHKIGRTNIWLVNLKEYGWIREKLLRPRMYLRIDMPEELKKENGFSQATLKLWDLDLKDMPGKLIDSGTCTFNARMMQWTLGRRSRFHLNTFKGLKTIKPNWNFEVIFNESLDQHDIAAEVMRVKRTK